LNTLILIAIVVVVFGLVILNKLTLKGTALMNVQQAQSLLSNPDLLILDVRTVQEYTQGHIKNARNIPLAELGSRIAELSQWKEKPVLVYCLSGGRSASAAKVLAGSGFAKVNNLEGGIGAWQSEKLPVET
jgi:rhodanese-related sulfurtransferase